MNDFSRRLQEHFQKYHQAETSKTEKALAQKADNEKFRAEFQEVVKTVIDPIFAQARDVLLSQNLFAAVSSKVPKGEIGQPDDYIGLHCWNKNSRNEPNVNPDFFLGYFAHHGFIQIKWRPPVAIENATPNVKEITLESVEKAAFTFVTNCFPIR